MGESSRPLPLAAVVAVSDEVRRTSRRSVKRDLIAGLLRQATTELEAELLATYLAGSPRQRRTGIGWRGVAALPDPAAESSLTVAAVDVVLQQAQSLAGPGSATDRAMLVERLFAAATGTEQHFLRGLITGELRQGALEGVMLEAVASAFAIPTTTVRRAAMLTGSTPEVARLAFAGGTGTLERIGLTVGIGLKPMLAASAPDLASALTDLGATPGRPVALDGKLDGIRVQVHVDGETTRVFSRSLDDITDRVPGLVASVRDLPVERAVLDGEALPDGVFFFDVLHLDGDDLIDAPARQRFERLAAVLPDHLSVPRIVTGDHAEARAFNEKVLDAGFEGLVLKDLDAPYAAGRRGSAWVKVKPRHTLDLVVLAVEWGSGRRRGKLSNIHLGARDPDTGGFVMLGKTFKGMTDAMLDWQTTRFLDLAVDPEAARAPGAWVVPVRPEQVVEIAFDGIHTSTRYPGGVALRFARVLGYRQDKPASEADTIDAVRALRRGAEEDA